MKNNYSKINEIADYMHRENIRHEKELAYQERQKKYREKQKEQEK